MTIEEAIKHAENIYRQEDEKSDCKECAEQHKQLAEWMEELQQYRAIGTVDYINEAILLTKADETLLSEYKAIGTIEECRKAREKEKIKELKVYGECEDAKLICPSCGEDLFDLIDCGFSNCPYCGQAVE